MSKPEKIAAIGICDFCGKNIPTGEWWTSKGRPRLHCCIECRQAANSRKMENRSEWMRSRIEDGEWVNPATINRPSSEVISKNSRAARLREVEEGRWRNPGQTSEAREKNSEPHKHTGVLASAIEKLRTTGKTSELSPEEQEAHRLYRKQLRNARKEEINQWHKEYYQKRMAAMTVEERDAQREKWRQQNRKKAQKKRNTDI